MASPTVDRRLGLVGNVAMKAPVTVLAAGNITLSGEQSVDGVAVKAVNASGVADRVLCTAQTDATQNGIWDVSTASWTRSKDADGNYDLGQGSTVLVNQGTVYAGTYWKLTTSGSVVVGTTALAWTQALATSLQTSTFTQAGAGAVQRDAQSKMRDFVSILDFIPVAQHAAIKDRTSTYDCYAAIMAAINSVTYGSGIYISGPRIYFPPGLYNCNTAIELKKVVMLVGDQAGFPGETGSTLKFPAGVSGITVNHYNTLNGGTEGVPTTSAQGSSIEGLMFQGGGGATAHGIWLRARALIRNCYFNGWSGNGIRVLATSGGGGAIEGNANNFRIEGGRIESCGSHGLFVSGADANAGLVQTLDLSANSGWGIYDTSFLGNAYVACHTATNTLGAYKSDNINARNLFVNCYSESDQPTSVLTRPAMVIGGLHAAGISGSFLVGDSAAGPVTSQMTARSADGQFQATLGSMLADAGSIFEIAGVNGVSTNFSPWRLKGAIGQAYFDWANAAGTAMLAFYDRNSVSLVNGFPRSGLGYAAGSGAVGLPMGLPLGYFGAGMRARVEAAAAPSTGDWLRGDLIWNTAPSSGTPAAWICTVAGTPGTWRAIAMVTTST